MFVIMIIIFFKFNSNIQKSHFSTLISTELHRRLRGVVAFMSPYVSQHFSRKNVCQNEIQNIEINRYKRSEHQPKRLNTGCEQARLKNIPGASSID